MDLIIISENGLLPYSTKPLPDPLLTQILSRYIVSLSLNESSGETGQNMPNQRLYLILFYIVRNLSRGFVTCHWCMQVMVSHMQCLLHLSVCNEFRMGCDGQQQCRTFYI